MKRTPSSSRTTQRCALAALLVTGLACGGPSNNDTLFDSGKPRSTGGTSSGGGAVLAGGGGLLALGGAGSAGRGGANHGGSTSGDSASGGTAVGGQAASGGAALGGIGGELTRAGAGGESDGGGGAGQGGTGQGGTGQGGSGGAAPTDCTVHDAQAKYFAQTGHCYLVHASALSFAAAQAECVSAGAHLVTIANVAENDFAWSLDKSAHWIGATDGKDRMATGPGSYAWLTGEAFSYTAWSANQPNATYVACNGACFEHCATQFVGGAPGQWNDRFCELTLPYVCEWEN